MARIAKSLAMLRKQIDDQFPNRSKKSDGWIGDQAHAARKSDHNPNASGVVQALDLTHDPANGFDAGKLADAIVSNRDRRVKYIIWDRRIVASYAIGGEPAWTWRSYGGSNPHTAHVHISVSDDAGLYDNATEWALTGVPVGVAVDPVRNRMAQLILNYESRRDSGGRLAVYNLPANDGGGSYEVAGINDRFHPEQAGRLKALIEAGRHTEAEAAARSYILDYTNVAQRWTDDPAVEFMLRNAVFNRGAKGAARILQRGVGVPDDGVIGPQTKAAMARLSRVNALLAAIRMGREDYERNVVGYRANFWRGLVNRWDKERRDAELFQAGAAVPRPREPAPPASDAAGGGAVGVATGGILGWLGIDPVFAAVAAVSIAVAAYLTIRHLRRS